MRIRALFALSMLVLAGFGLLACGPQETLDPAAEQAAADLAWLKENKPILDEKRQELRSVRDQIAGREPQAPEGTAPEGEEGTAEEAVPMTPEELEAKANVLQEEVDRLFEQVGARIASYLNNSGIEMDRSTGMIVGELTPDQQLAIDYKIDEDMVLAQEYIDKGGDYVRAIEIYTATKKLAPDHEALNAAIAEAEALRWMTPDRFSQVKKRMTEDEVRELLGQVNLRNVEEYDDGRKGWFYKKDNGGAAGVWFKKRDENWVVDVFDFEAVKPQVIGGDG